MDRRTARQTDRQDRQTDGQDRQTDGQDRQTDGQDRQTDGQDRQTDRQDRQAERRVARQVAERDRELAMAEMYGECGLLRELAEASGVRLDDTVDSLTALDQLLPRWRDDPQVSQWLGTDAGLYLGTVIRRRVPGARWRLAADGRPLMVLDTGFELDATAIGRDWAVQGAPQLAAVYRAAGDG
ncbi:MULTISPECIES: DUF6278 family protein [Kitasatospora]|uniref:DUF3806 domain-containing protein n=1 Tax=Kitasatospora setae (strain ATCC 33774 / DSM 43861 / JCM 3304 / KCC A-0304 / NBRC 14216 / KM-6054) TaxID=452652 RepID=E4NHT1_KITSK|nr:DUF6278 family protein [Kitasatospora setae]BAJ31061.1 hypothetical protein KSE_52850 [Kitasatospora setae KM-6054]